MERPTRFRLLRLVVVLLVVGGLTEVVLATMSSAVPAQWTAYVADEFGGTLTAINLVTRAVLATIDVGGYPDAVSIAPNARTACVADQLGGTAALVNLSTHATTLFAVGVRPSGIVFAPVHLASKSKA